METLLLVRGSGLRVKDRNEEYIHFASNYPQLREERDQLWCILLSRDLDIHVILAAQRLRSFAYCIRVKYS